jgi:hypothetical protein
MGTDIHLYVERRESGRWVSADTWEPSEYEEDKSILTVPYRKHFYAGRNYGLFAMLADVRNGHGFAGVDTGDGFVIIAAPRGLPSDMSPELAAEAKRHLDHTPSWLTVAELHAYDWTRTTTLRGWVNGPQYYAWARYKKGEGADPESFCGGISGLKIVHVSDAELQRQVEQIQKACGGDRRDEEGAIKAQLSNVYAQVSWQTPYYRAARSFLSECLPRLWRLGSPEDVRIVFWFDS